jgi:hypothetical protein
MGHKQANDKSLLPDQIQMETKWKHMQIGLLPLWHHDAKKGENTTRSILKRVKVLILLIFISIVISVGAPDRLSETPVMHTTHDPRNAHEST